MIKIIGLSLASLLFAGCATGLGGLSTFVREDVQRGLEIAQAANDPAGVACATAILAAIPEAAAPELHAVGAFSAFVKVRELRRKVDGGVVDEAVHNACAPLVLDAEKTLLKLGAAILPGGGIAGKLIR